MATFFHRSLLFAAMTVLPLGAPLRAGDDGGPRREFHQSAAYPYTFVPVSYLETGGPKMMRYAETEPGCAHHDAPLLPTPSPTPTPTAKADEKAEAKKEVAPAVSPVPAQPTPPPAAYPPPEDAPAAGNPDLTRMPEEVMSYFKNPYNAGPRGHHLFDPIFEPGYHEGPKSKATYHLTDKP
jgi:hypothetical protein